MNLRITGLGAADRKKVIFLGALLVVAIYFLWPSSPPSEVKTARPKPGVDVPPEVQPVARTTIRRRPGSGETGNLAEFRPSLRPKKGQDTNPTTSDPTLRLDLLERLQRVSLEGGTRSLFEYRTGAAPQQLALAKEPPKIVITHPKVGPNPPPPPAPPPPEPKAPPVPLKFYGFINPAKTSDKRAFFLDGEEIIVATEGQLIKNRYKIVRIGVNSAVVEDTQFKNSQQTLPLVEEQAG